jgi:hypothetical protein
LCFFNTLKCICRSSHAISDLGIYHSDVGNSEGDSRSNGNDVSFLVCTIYHLFCTFFFDLFLVVRRFFVYDMCVVEDLEFKIIDTVLDDALFGFFRKQVCFRIPSHACILFLLGLAILLFPET